MDGIPQTVVGENGVEFHMSGNPFDLYDIPRSALDPSPDDDATIYDYPLDFDLDDMEIYDYPPDAAELGNLIYPTIYSSICPFINPHIHLSIYLSTYLSIYIFVHLSIL